MAAHAVLSASAAGRWTACPPSARLELTIPGDGETDYSRQGTLAHKIAEAILRNGTGTLTKPELLFFSKEEFYDAAMLRHCEDYAAYVMENTPDEYHLFVEEQLDTSDYIPEGFGTCDALKYYLEYNPETGRWPVVLNTYDLKYGKGVPVYAEDNKQQKIYALGVLKKLGRSLQPEKIIMHIYQPRIPNNSSWEISTVELLKWAEAELKPAALIAFEGGGEFKPGNHCGFCKAKPVCRALAEYNLELLRQDFRDLSVLSDREFLEIYSKLSLINGWTKAVEEYALKEALKGKTWPGYKLVEGRSNRKYKDEAAIAEELKMFGYEECYQPTKLLNLEDMETYVSREHFNLLVAPMLEKPPGKPTLAVQDDKRKAFDPNAELKNDFEQLNNEDYLL